MADKESNDIRLETPPQVACPHCSVAVDTEGQSPFATVTCAACGKNFILPIPFGPFILTGRLGEGGMGAVFKGFDPGLKRPVAVKVMRRELGLKPEFVQQFEHEAQMLAKLNNPHVVQVYSTGTEDGQPYIVMELVDQGRLDLVMTKKKRLDEAFVVRTAIDIINGLRAAAAIGLAHGDLKPQNILFDRDDNAKVVDFGLARFKGEAWQPGVIWGTPYYIAPEVVRGKQPNLQADIYSLGCTLFHAIAGQTPFDKESIEETVVARLNEKPPVLGDLRAGLHPETVAVIARMMEVEIIRRYPNYDSLLEDMTAAEAAIEKSAPPKAARAPKSKNSARSWWMISSALSAVVVLGFWLAAGHKQKKAPTKPSPPVRVVHAVDTAPAQTPATATPAPEKVEAPAEVEQHDISDTAANYSSWTDGSTGGSGFGPWILRGGPNAGFFLGTSGKNGGGNIDTDGKSWGLYASANDTAAAWRPLSGGALHVATQRFRIEFDHGSIEKGGPSAGVGLQNAATNNLWEFFLAGGSSTYKIRAASGVLDTGVRATKEGIRVELRLKTATDYAARVVCGTETNSFTGRLIEDADQGIVQVHLWNYSAGPGSSHDTYFNNMAIVPVRVK